MQKGVLSQASESQFSQGRVTLSFSTPWDVGCMFSLLHQKQVEKRGKDPKYEDYPEISFPRCRFC